MLPDGLKYYLTPSLMTDPGAEAPLLKGLPDEIPALCKVVQNVLVHIFWAGRYGLELSAERRAEVNIRRASTMLAQIKAMDDRLLTVPRPPERRLVGNCRDFTVLMVTLLRHVGIPARARCGFGAYFKDKLAYIDHWVAEYWHAGDERWVLVDAQMDALQRDALALPFDPCDVPRDQFVTGSLAWQWCRAGEADPEQFGIFDMQGLWFVRGDFGRDIAALNNLPLLPWDCWGLIDKRDEDLSDDDLALLDHAAVLVEANDFDAIRALYESHDGLRVPATIASYQDGQRLLVDVFQDEVFVAPVAE